MRNGNDRQLQNFINENRASVGRLNETVSRIPFEILAGLLCNLRDERDLDSTISKMKENVSEEQRGYISQLLNAGNIKTIKDNFNTMRKENEFMNFVPGINFEDIYKDVGIIGVDIFGKLVTGKEASVRLKDEMNAKYFFNDIIKQGVFDISNMIYVGIFMGCSDGQMNSLTRDEIYNDGIFKRYGGLHTLVEVDALLIRYMSTLSEEDMELFVGSFVDIVFDKLVRLILSQGLLMDLVSKYVPEISARGSYKDREELGPTSIYMLNFICKMLSDGINGVNKVTDSKTITQLVDGAEMKLRLSGSAFDISGTTQNVVSDVFGVQVGRPKYLDRFISTFLKYHDEKKLFISDCMNRNRKQFTNKDRMTRVMAMSAYKTHTLGVEGFNIDTSRLVNSIRKFAVERAGIYAHNVIIGLESDHETNLDQYKRKPRIELLKTLSSKERNTYTKLESELTKYSSDIINAKDNFKKDNLLVRSKRIGKIISLELDRVKTDNMRELLFLLEEKKFKLDEQLSSRDFNKERNTRMYGQLATSKDWDY